MTTIGAYVYTLYFSRSGVILRFRSAAQNVRIQHRKPLHNSRRNGRNNIEPNPLEHLKIDSRPLKPSALIRPFFFTVGVSIIAYTHNTTPSSTKLS